MSQAPSNFASDAAPSQRESSQALRWQRLKSFWPEALTLLVAALTRFWRLDYHSVWFDESVSLYWAIDAKISYMWPATFGLVEEKHPPAYYTLLKLWHWFFDWFGLGRSDVALRSLGALLGILTVLGVLLLVRRVGNRVTALLSALLVAISPVLIWYSQEIRMFQPAATGVVWALYFVLRAWRQERIVPRTFCWLGYLVSIEFALYSYLFSAFMLPAAGLTVALLWLHETPANSRPGKFSKPVRSRSRFIEGALAVALSGLLFLPLAYNAWIVNAAESMPGTAFANFVGNSTKLLKIFTIWKESWPDSFVALALLFFGFLLFVGLAIDHADTMTKDNKSTPERLLLLIWIGTPFLIANILLSRSDSIFQEDRYLLMMAPFVLWAIGRGVTIIYQRWQVAGWTVGLLAVLLLTATLPRLWSPAMYRENWRAAAEYIDWHQQASPALNSAGVAHLSYTHRAMDWYIQQKYSFDELPIFGLFGNPIAADQADEIIRPPIQGIPKELGAETLWLSESHLEGVDDEGVLRAWLDQNYPVITQQSPRGIQLTGYALRTFFEAIPATALDSSALDTTTSDAELAPGISLLACELMTPVVQAHDDALHPPSGWVHLRLWWQATGDIAEDYLATAQVVGDDGIWGERLERDGEALRFYPTSQWSNYTEQGTIVRDEIDINLNPVTPSGEYRVEVGLRDQQGNSAAKTVSCGQVTVEN